MIRVFVTGQCIVSINGTNYSVDVPATAYDDGNTVVGTINLNVTGPLTDTQAQFKTKLVTASNTWKASVQTIETMKAKLGRLFEWEIK